MRYLIDIAHPAHVHFYRYLVAALESEDHEIRVVAREKDVTLELLRLYGIPHVSVGVAGAKGRLGQARELAERDWSLYRIAREFRPDVILTRNPAGAQVGRLARGVTGIFDTDDGRQAGVHYRAAAPFAHVITTPDCLPDDLGRKHVKYPSYKALAYLHPDRYTPDPSVRDLLGVGESEPYFLVRFVAMTASHDHAEAGLGVDAKRQLIDRLREAGRVFITSEAELAPEWEELRFSIPPDRMHDALAFSSLAVGDSGSVVAEAAVLGVPSVRVSTFSGRLAPQEEMEHRYGLTFSFRPDQRSEVLAKIEQLVSAELGARHWQERRERLLDEKCDLTAWHLDYLDRLSGRAPRGGLRSPAPAPPP